MQQQAEKKRDSTATYTPGLYVHYRENVVKSIMDKMRYKNIYQVPRLWKITVNMGVGKMRNEAKYLEEAERDLKLITGQKPVFRRAKKSIAGFKVKKGDIVGLFVTLRRKMMYDFFNRLINVAIPRSRDFKGFYSKSFDGKGNYTIGVKEHTIFPEIPYDKTKFIKGMNITIVTTAKTDEEAKELLKHMGMPFRN